MLNEVKFADLGKKTGKGSSLKDLKKAAHSQGIDLGDEKRNAHHCLLYTSPSPRDS